MAIREILKLPDKRLRLRSEPVKQIDAKGLLATCLQHEIDHINGVLFIDHLSKLKRDRVIKKFAKAAKNTTTSSATKSVEA